MRLGFDLDGTVADFCHSYNLYFPGIDFPVDDPAFPPCYDYPQHFGATDAQVAEAWEKINANPLFWESLKIYPGCEDALRWIEQLTHDHEVYFITTRSGRTAKRQSEAWLRYYGVRNPTVLVTSKKGPIVNGLKLDAYIDDRPEVLLEITDWLASPPTKLYLQRRPWNTEFQLVASGYGITSLSHVNELLSALTT